MRTYKTAMELDLGRIQMLVIETFSFIPPPGMILVFYGESIPEEINKIKKRLEI